VPQRTRRDSIPERVGERLNRRIWPLGVSVVFVALGLAYFFRWGPIGEHTPSLWISPTDLWFTYFASSQLAHGHFGAIYNSGSNFLEFPGILIVLAPLGALSNSFHSPLFEVTKTQTVPALNFAARAPNIPFLNAEEFHFRGSLYVSHPQWVAAVDPYVLVLSCTALFACDALAERLQVSRQRRAVLSVVEAALLWNVIVWWGHPEDAIAVAFAVYALIFALDKRFVGAGWLFGAAVAFQPLVLLMLPVLLAMAGRRSALSMAVRSLLPTAVLLLAPLCANFRVTLHTLVDQPSSPNFDHATPWTALSPSLGGQGPLFKVAAGPVRVVAVLLAVGLGVWVFRRWLSRPELLAWACVLALALRSYTESVMTDYYAWAALAVGVVVAGRCSRIRFDIAVVLALATTLLAQWRLGWLPWWSIQVAGLTALLAVCSQPTPLVSVVTKTSGGSTRSKSAAAVRGPSRSGTTQTRTAAERNQSRSGTTKPSTAAQGRSRSGTTKPTPGARPATTKRSRDR
jgi:hypothetical protein